MFSWWVCRSINGAKPAPGTAAGRAARERRLAEMAPGAWLRPFCVNCVEVSHPLEAPQYPKRVILESRTAAD